MPSTCCICRDVLDETHNVICATSCGHVYHYKCLMSWIKERKTCPICRTEVDVMNILKLFFNMPVTPAESPSVLENEILSLKACVSNKSAELEACRKENKELAALAEENKTKMVDMRRSLIESMSKCIELRSRVKSTTILENKIKKLEKLLGQLTNDIHLQNASEASGTHINIDVSSLSAQYEEPRFSIRIVSSDNATEVSDRNTESHGSLSSVAVEENQSNDSEAENNVLDRHSKFINISGKKRMHDGKRKI